MRFTSGERKFFSIALAVTLIVCGALYFAIALTPRTNRFTEVPILRAVSPTQTVLVTPWMFYPNFDLTGTGQIDLKKKVYLPLKVGDSLWISIPEILSQSVWNLRKEILQPDGSSKIEESLPFRRGEKTFLALKSTKAQPLINVEIAQASARFDRDGNNIPRAFWSIDTLPRN